MAKLWKKDGPNGKEVDLSTFKISEPTVIYLSGYLTTDKNRKSAREGINTIEKLLNKGQQPAKNVEVFSWSHTNLKYIFNVCAYNFRPQKSYCPAAELFAQSIIKPLVSDNSKKIPPEEAKKRLMNLTLVGYSFGTVFAQEVFNASNKMMQDMGYKKEECKDILKEVVLISVANLSQPTKEKSRFTTFYLEAVNDITVRWKERIWRPLRSLFNNKSKNLVIKPLSKNSLLINAAVQQQKMWHWEKDPKGGNNKLVISPLLPSWMLVKSNHELPHYITEDDDHNEFSKIALNILQNSVRRKSSPNIIKLMALGGKYPKAERKDYRNKVSKAIKHHKK